MTIKRTKSNSSNFYNTEKVRNSTVTDTKKIVNIYRTDSFKNKLNKYSGTSSPSNKPTNTSPKLDGNLGKKGVNGGRKRKSRKHRKTSSNKGEGKVVIGNNPSTTHEFLDLTTQEENFEPKLKEVTDKRVIREDIHEGHSLDSLPIIDRLKLGLRVHRRMTNKEAVQKEKEALAIIEKEQTYYQTLKYFIQSETEILYTDKNIDQVVLQIDRKFTPYLPQVRDDLSYLRFREQPATKDMLLSYGNIPHLYFISLEKF